MPEQVQPDPAGSLSSLPVNLLIEGWPCLVVGGGHIAHRKTMRLISSGAIVRVVSPQLCQDLAALVKTGRATHRPGCFLPEDVSGMRIVFAATNDRGVNRQVLDAARAAGAFCCCVDGNWTAGDFVTPATLQMDGITVAVSTGGRSCRQARMVKNTLRRHLGAIETADLLVLGTSHAELPLERREAIQLVGTQRKAVGNMLMQVWGIHEFMLLTTCNRVELVAIASAAAGQSDLLGRILGFDRLGRNEWYRLTGPEAFEHMALVTAGMRSQSPGEYHVASQVKEALQTAVGNGWANGMLSAWIAEALHISKHLKNEVTPLLTPVEIEDLAVDCLAESQAVDGTDPMVLVMGTGMLGRGLVEKILQRHKCCIWCYHNHPPALEPAWSDRVQLISLVEMQAMLGGCDVVFCAAEAPGYVLDESHAPCFDRERPVRILDLGMPRNVSPALIALLPKADLVNLDRLKAWAARRNGSLDRAMVMSREIVEQHREGYAALITHFQGRNQTQ